MSYLLTNRIAFTITIFCFFIYVSSANAAPPKDHDFTKISPNSIYAEDEILVQFATRANKLHRSKTEKKQILNSLGGADLMYDYKIVPGLSLVKLPPGQTVIEALKIYNNTEGILHAQPNYELYVFATEPNDIYFNDLWGLHNTGQSHPVEGGGTSSGTPDADIDAPEAWDIITDANDIIVAVIDTGVDYTHPDLSDNIWINSLEEPNDANNDGYPGIQGVDDDGDGLIDEDSGGFEPGDPNWTNDLFEDDEKENGDNSEDLLIPAGL